MNTVNAPTTIPNTIAFYRVCLKANAHMCSTYAKLCQLLIEQDPKLQIASQISNNPLFQKADQFSIRIDAVELTKAEMPKALHLLELQRKYIEVAAEINLLLMDASQWNTQAADELIISANLLEKEFSKL